MDHHKTRILIADDHTIFRDGLRRLLESEPEFQVAGEAADGAEALQLIEQLHPDILLLDLAMPKMPGLETLRELSTQGNKTKVILLTAAIEKRQIVEALQMGARGVIMKDAATQLLMKGIRTVMNGQFWVGREAVADMVSYLREKAAQVPASPAKAYGLTKRELEILSTIVAGLSNKEIAQKFSLSEDTVKHHLTNIFDKVGVNSRLELALFALNHRLVEPASYSHSQSETREIISRVYFFYWWSTQLRGRVIASEALQRRAEGPVFFSLSSYFTPALPLYGPLHCVSAHRCSTVLLRTGSPSTRMPVPATRRRSPGTRTGRTSLPG